VAAAGPALLIAALSNARAASSSVSWSLRARMKNGERTIQDGTVWLLKLTH
jgi:hypothetical protein